MNKLAIVIPAFKKQFFQETLECFANQTNQNFTLYIGDDHSDDDLEKIISHYTDKLAITYHRFKTNIGSKHIVDQWDRCIKLIKNENWIWLFSDDDLVDQNAVESFWWIFKETGGNKDIYSFNTCVIDRNGQLISKAPNVPSFESSEEMAFHLLMGKRANCMPDHIFSRTIYEKNNGFVKTLYGQGADWANSIMFSQEKGFSIIPDALVYWRYSGENITSIAFKHKSEMIIGHFQFIRWILYHFSYLKKEQNHARYLRIKNAALENLLNVIRDHYKGVPVSKLFPFAYLLMRHLGVPLPKVISLLIKSSTYKLDKNNKKTL